MLPAVLLEMAWIVVIARSAHKVFYLFHAPRKPWLDIAFHIAIILIALSFLF